MSEITHTHGETRLPPKNTTGPLTWVKENLFSPWYNGILTVLGAAIIYGLFKPLYDWGIKNASFGTVCGAGHDGACWAFIRDMWPVFMVGTYPHEERWRILIVLAVVVAIGASLAFKKVRAFKPIWVLWALSPLVIFFLIRGGSVTGLTQVSTSHWGGLMLTVMFAGVGMICAFPISLALALGRASDIPVIRAICIAYIELIRGVPLITLLFMASVVLPLFFPPEMEIDKLLRAQIGITLFFAAYLAENIRGGLQALPKGQEEAARALGMGYWQRMLLIILPQSLRIVIPPMVNSFIGILKDTSLVGIVGLVDLLQVVFAATSNPKWLGRIEEAYVFVAIFYWFMCYGLSRYSQHLEKRYAVDKR